MNMSLYTSFNSSEYSQWYQKSNWWRLNLNSGISGYKGHADRDLKFALIMEQCPLWEL